MTRRVSTFVIPFSVYVNVIVADPEPDTDRISPGVLAWLTLIRFALLVVQRVKLAVTFALVPSV